MHRWAIWQRVVAVYTFTARRQGFNPRRCQYDNIYNSHVSGCWSSYHGNEEVNSCVHQPQPQDDFPIVTSNKIQKRWFVFKEMDVPFDSNRIIRSESQAGINNYWFELTIRLTFTRSVSRKCAPPISEQKTVWHLFCNSIPVISNGTIVLGEAWATQL